ncbi:MAG: PIN domain-containing protein [Staphylothermus sp.]|nr:PIN domain-containing protein [Staphylothermus sp.]
MEIVDTVYLVAYFKPSDPLHEDAVRIIENLNEERRVSQASLIEFDLLMKSRGLRLNDRLKAWMVLNKLISNDSVEAVLPLDMIIALYLYEKYSLDYFDALIAAQCIARNAKPLTIDKEIIQTIARKEEIINDLRKLHVG